MESALILVLGLGLLMFGRRLFWLFVGMVGFLGGWHLATLYFGGEESQLNLIIAASAGLLGVLLAVFVQKIAVVVAGFLAGGMALMTMAGMWSVTAMVPIAIPFLVGGFIGAILAHRVFEWGLILLSAFAGAATVVEALHLKEAASATLFMVLLVVGIAVQWRMESSSAARARYE